MTEKRTPYQTATETPDTPIPNLAQWLQQQAAEITRAQADYWEAMSGVLEALNLALEQAEDAQRWARAWKASAKAHRASAVHFGQQLDEFESGYVTEFRQAIVVLGQERNDLAEQVEALQTMLTAAPPVQRQYITRPCTECGGSALFDPLTSGPAYCTKHREAGDA
jgi:hypothetical protein